MKLLKAHIILIALSSLFFAACCGPSTVIKQVKVLPPDLHDTIPAELVYPFDLDTIKLTVLRIDTIKGTVNDVDTIFPFYQGIKLNDRGDTTVIAKFFTEDHSFDIDYRPDTITVTDTITISSMDLEIKGDTWLEKLIWLISGVLTVGIIQLIRKKNKENKDGIGNS